MGRKKNMTKRSEILKTAYRMFCEKGFEQVLLREIAEEVEISKALLQHYFSRLWHVYNSVATNLRSYLVLSDWNDRIGFRPPKFDHDCKIPSQKMFERQKSDLVINTKLLKIRRSSRILILLLNSLCQSLFLRFTHLIKPTYFQVHPRVEYLYSTI